MPKSKKNIKPLIYWFEDDLEERKRFFKSVENELNGRAEIIDFLASEKAVELKNKSGSYRHRILEAIKEHASEIKLIVCDEDLSTDDNFRGLNADPIESIAHDQGIPLVIYSKGSGDDIQARLLENRGFSERKFILPVKNSDDQKKLPRRVLSLFNGCNSIQKFVRTKIFNESGTKLDKPKSGTPSEWLAALLNNSNIETRLNLYASGDQQYISSLSTLSLTKDNLERSSRIIAAELAYWLWESVLRFPGILLNSVAAASMLNIDKEQFCSKPEYQEPFKDAKYSGPFSEYEDFWWRDRLMDILYEEDAPSGLDYLISIGKKPKPCMCSVDDSLNAGFYCVVSKEPVSSQKSKGNIPFFPKGADLARISQKELRKFGPWAGSL